MLWTIYLIGEAGGGGEERTAVFYSILKHEENFYYYYLLNLIEVIIKKPLFLKFKIHLKVNLSFISNQGQN